MRQDELNAQREPAIWLRRQPGKAPRSLLGRWLRRPEDRAPSLTRLGGLPALPPGIAWPRQGQSGTPLHFLAQVDLSQLPPTPLGGAADAPALPKSGLLFFFADMVEEMLWRDNGGPFATTRVLFADRAGADCAPPDDIPDILHGFGETAGGHRTGIAVYPAASLDAHVIDTFKGIDALPGDAHAAAAQAAMVASIERAIGPIPVFSGPGSMQAIEAANPREYIEEYRFDGGRVRRELRFPRHQMLGIGRALQGAAEGAHADGTILLLQLDTDWSVHDRFQFCDMGAAQFWIEPADLAAGRFDKAWGTTEGG